LFFKKFKNLKEEKKDFFNFVRENKIEELKNFFYIFLNKNKKFNVK
jgi:hypothetical protein